MNVIFTIFKVETPSTTFAEPKNIRISLSRNKKKEDFGLVLGCKIYIKEIIPRTVADKEGSLQDGDQIIKINGTSIEGLTLKEARKVFQNIFTKAKRNDFDIIILGH